MDDLKYKTILEPKIILNENEQEVELKKCPCGNMVFYITDDGDKICSCCLMTQEEAEIAEAETQNLQKS